MKWRTECSVHHFCQYWRGAHDYDDHVPFVVNHVRQLNWRRLKIFVLDLIAQKPKLTVDCERIATVISHFHLSFSEVNGGWPIILKLAENSFWFNHQFFSSYLKFLIQACTVSLLFENCHWSLKVPLSCNLMGYLLAIKINGHEFNLPRNGFWPKYHSVKFSVTFTGVNRQRRL